MDYVLADVHSQLLWGLLFPALVLWAGESGVGLGPLDLQGGPLQPRYPSQFLTTTRGCGTSPFHVSAPPTSLNVASF